MIPAMNVRQSALPIPNPGDWWDLPRAAEYLRLSERQVRRLTDSGKLKIHIFGKRGIAVWAQDVRDLAAARERAGLAGDR